jgi:hypothetical protein
MKKYIVVFISAILCTACLGYKELPVEYDYSYKGNFKRYRTFDIMKSASTVPDSSVTSAIIEKSIIARMKFLGYRQSSNKPHLIIGFKMFNDSLRFNGYIQPEIEDWVRNRTENLSYDTKKFNLNTGTLLIQFYDRKQNRSIWQGYATTSYGTIDFNNSRHLRNAVISILDKYRFWADGFMEGTMTQQHENDL